MRVVLAAALAAAVAVLRMPAALACADEAFAELAKHGVARDQLAVVDVQRQSTSEGGNQGYLVWLTLRGCQGYAVVETTTSCSIVQTYTTKDCRIEGISSY